MAVGGQFEQQVDVALVAEAVVEGDEVGVPEERLDLDLHRQLPDRLLPLLLRCPAHALLVDHLHRPHEPARQVPHQEHLSEPPRPQLPQHLKLPEPRLLHRLGALAGGRVGLAQLGEAGGVFEGFGPARGLRDELLAGGLGGVLAVLEGGLLPEGRGEQLEALLVGLGGLLERGVEVLVAELLRDELTAAGRFGLGAAGEGRLEEERRREERFIGDHNY